MSAALKTRITVQPLVFDAVSDSCLVMWLRSQLFAIKLVETLLLLTAAAAAAVGAKAVRITQSYNKAQLSFNAQRKSRPVS